MIAQVVYTNSNCSDVWPMFFGQNDKHTDIPICVISDKVVGYEPHLDFMYSNDAPYWKVWSAALEDFGVDYFIYLQEDFVLYDDVDEGMIFEYVDFLHYNPEYSFIRLLKATSFKGERVNFTLYEVEPGNKNVFAMQPTIWRTKDYLRLLDATREPKWLETKNYRNQMINMGMGGLYHYDGEDRRGKYHYDSDVYPYIATALVKGKWAMTEYGDELKPLLKKYNIDPTIRGVL